MMKKQNTKSKPVPFDDAVKKLMDYMFNDDKSFEYPEIQLCDEIYDEEVCYDLDEPICTEMINNFNDSYEETKEKYFTIHSEQIMSLSNAISNSSDKKCTTSRKNKNEMRSIGEMKLLMDKTTSSLEVSEKIARANKERINALTSQQSKEPSTPAKSAAERQKLFVEREKFRQSYRK